MRTSSLRRRFAAFLVTASITVACAQDTQAQQAWSPAPFTPKAEMRRLPSANVAVPTNRLRAESSPEANTAFAARWKGASSSNISANAVTPVSEVGFDTPNRQVAPAPTVAIPRTSSVDEDVFAPMPRIGFSKQVAQTKQPLTIQSQPTVPAASQDHRFDQRFDEAPLVPKRAIASEVIAASSLNASTGEVVTAAEWSDRNQPTLAPSRSVLARTQADSLLEKRDGFAEPPTPAFPPKEPELMPTDDPNGARKKSSSDLEDLSAAEEDLRSRKSFPPKPKGSLRTELSCDDVRDRAAAGKIDKIDLDVAPTFAIGPKDKLTAEEKRRNFSQSAPVRNWYDHDGGLIAEGKLLDIENHAVIVENSSGARQSIDVRNLSDADAAYVFESWGLPVTCSLGNQPIGPRTYEGTTVAWKASGLCHKPLYFEEIQLERSGHEYGPVVQPALSTVHFFKNIAFLPYKMGIHPMNECQYALGHYRPGNCAPWSIEPVPLSLRGLAAQAKVVTGAVLALP